MDYSEDISSVSTCCKSHPGFDKEASIIAKGLAVMMMIILHLFAFPERNADLIDFMWIGHPIFKSMSLCIPIYVFIAGYASHLMISKVNNHYTYHTLKSIGRLYTKFWSIALPALIITLLFNLLPVGSDGNNCQIADDIHNLSLTGGGYKGLLLNLLCIKPTYCYEWWFLYLYVELSIIALLLNKVKSAKTLAALFCITLVGGYWFRMRYDYTTSIVLGHILQLSKFLSVYILGMIFCRYGIYQKICTNSLFKSVADNPLVPFIIIFTVIIIRTYAPMKMIADNIFTPILVLCCILIASKQHIIKKGLLFFGTLSTEIWLIHAFFIYYGFNGLIYFQRNPLISLLLVITFSVVSAILLRFMYNTFNNYIVNQLKRIKAAKG